MESASLLEGCLAYLKVHGWARIQDSSNSLLTSLLCSLETSVASTSASRKPSVLRPYSQCEAPRASMSSITGLSAQPMHTDAAYYPLPPRYIVFFCSEPGEAECPTYVWPLNWDKMLQDRPSVLMQPGWIAKGGKRAPFYCQILTAAPSSRMFIRFDPICMKPPLAGNMTSAVNILNEYSKKVEFFWEAGDILIVDNWRCLHARGSGAASAPSRRLLRWAIGGGDGLVI